MMNPSATIELRLTRNPLRRTAWQQRSASWADALAADTLRWGVGHSETSPFYVRANGKLFGCVLHREETPPMRIQHHRTAPTEQVRTSRLTPTPRYTWSEVPLSRMNWNGSTEYWIDLVVGTPQKIYQVQPDTCSSDLWLFSSKMRPRQPFRSADPAPGQRRLYNADASSTYRPTEMEFYVRYEDNSSAAGPVFTDVVSLPPAAMSNGRVVCKDVYIGEGVTIEGKKLSLDKNIDGILGLGFREGSSMRPRQLNLFTRAMEPHTGGLQWEWNMLAMHFDEEDGASWICLGQQPDQWRERLQRAWVPTNPDSPFWSVQSPAIQVGMAYKTGRDQGFQFYDIILDTGTNRILLPDGIVETLKAQMDPTLWTIDPERGLLFRDDPDAFYPDLVFHIGTQLLTFPGRKLLWYRMPGRDSWWLSAVASLGKPPEQSNRDGTEGSSFQNASPVVHGRLAGSLDTCILGLPFFKIMDVVFEDDKSKLSPMIAVLPRREPSQLTVYHA